MNRLNTVQYLGNASRYICIFSAVLLFLLIPAWQCQVLAQHFTDILEPEAPTQQPETATASVMADSGLPEPFVGVGRLAISIENFKGANPKRISQLAHRVEVWLGDKRLAALNHLDPEVVTEKNRRIFLFPEISLANGYYFITVRLYGHAALYGRDKWHGETFQVGIHPDKTSRVYKKVAFFHF